MREQTCSAVAIRTSRVSSHWELLLPAHSSGNLTRGSWFSVSVWGRCCICSQSAADSRETLQMQLAREMNYLFNCTSLVQARTILAEGRVRNNG